MRKVLIISFFVFMILINILITCYASGPIVNSSTLPSVNSTLQVAPTIKNVLIIPPKKTNYDIGEKLDLSGLSVTVVYSDDTIEQIEKGYTVTGYNKNKKGIQPITISYKGFSRTYNVNVGNVSSVNLDDTEKLPQTGDFFDLKDGLYLLIGASSIILIFIIYISVALKGSKK